MNVTVIGLCSAGDPSIKLKRIFAGHELVLGWVRTHVVVLWGGAIVRIPDGWQRLPAEVADALRDERWLYWPEDATERTTEPPPA